MPEKLDLFSKILLATSTINYMASSLNAVNEQYKDVLYLEEKVRDDNDISTKALETLVADQDKKLEEVSENLAGILKSFGNYLHKKDCVCAIDARIYKLSSEILLEGKDEVDNTYDDESVWTPKFNA